MAAHQHISRLILGRLNKGGLNMQDMQHVGRYKNAYNI
jgi:hypothetical protein